MSDPVTGSCFCGAVRFSVKPPSLFCTHCHCTMCQRAHGAAYVTWFAVPYAQFSIDTGADVLQRFASSDHGTRSFCSRCGSSLFCESKHKPDHIDIVLANLSAPLDRSPQAHAYWDDRAAWDRADDGLPKLGGKTGVEPIS